MATYTYWFFGGVLKAAGREDLTIPTGGLFPALALYPANTLYPEG